MQTLQLVTDQHRRGAQIFARGPSDALDRRGHETSIVYLYRGGESIEARTSDVTLSASRDHPLESLPGCEPRLLRRISALANDDGVDVVQVNCSRPVKYACAHSLQPA